MSRDEFNEAVYGMAQPDFNAEPDAWREWAERRIAALVEELALTGKAVREAEKARDQSERALAGAQALLDHRRKNSVTTLEPGHQVTIKEQPLVGAAVVEEVRIKEAGRVLYVVRYWWHGERVRLLLNAAQVESTEGLPAPPPSVPMRVNFTEG